MLLTASDATNADSSGIAVALATVRLTLHHQVSDPIAWVNNHKDPEHLLEQLAQRELARLLLTAPLSTHLADGGHALSETLGTALQRATDESDLGVTIVSIRFRNLQPPANIALAWQEALSAKEDASRAKFEAERFAVTQAAKSSYLASAIIETARAETIRTRLVATADQTVFTNMRATYHEFPKLHTTRAKMDALERALAGKRKIIIAADPKNIVLELDLKKARPDLLESLGGSN